MESKHLPVITAGFGNDYGVSRRSFLKGLAAVTLTATADAATTPSRLDMGTVLSTGASGLVKFGFVQHIYAAEMAEPYKGVNAKAMRIGDISYARYMKINVYPGPQWSAPLGGLNLNWQLQHTVDEMVALGMDVIIVIDSGFPNPPDATTWPAFWAAVAQANVKNADHVILEVGNEPNWTKYTGAQYATILKSAAKAIRAVSPKLKIGAPTINASYADLAVKFVDDLLATPGIMDCFDVGTFHPYYQTPEACFGNDLTAFIGRVDAAAQKAGRRNIEFAADEVGWSNAIGALKRWGLNPQAENVRSRGDTYVQPKDIAADYYSRYIPIARATAKLRIVTFYSLADENSHADREGTNVQAHFGVYEEGWKVLKPAGLVCKDLLQHVHAATGAQMYHRQGEDRGNWYTRFDLPNTKELVAWTRSGVRDDIIAVNAAQGATLSISTAGAPATAAKVTLPAGITMVPVKLASRSIILSADKPIDFPEFA